MTRALPSSCSVTSISPARAAVEWKHRFRLRRYTGEASLKPRLFKGQRRCMLATEFHPLTSHTASGPGGSCSGLSLRSQAVRLMPGLGGTQRIVTSALSSNKTERRIMDGHGSPWLTVDFVQG